MPLSGNGLTPVARSTRPTGPLAKSYTPLILHGVQLTIISLAIQPPLIDYSAITAYPFAHANLAKLAKSAYRAYTLPTPNQIITKLRDATQAPAFFYSNCPTALQAALRHFFAYCGTVGTPPTPKPTFSNSYTQVYPYPASQPSHFTHFMPLKRPVEPWDSLL